MAQQPTVQQMRSRGTWYTAAGVIGMCACLVWFAAGGFVGSRDEVFGGWIVATFLGAVAFGILASRGQIWRRRAQRAADESARS